MEVYSMRELMEMSDQKRAEMMICDQERRIKARNTWIYVNSKNARGVYCREHEYFIEEDRFAPGSGSIDSLDDWIRHLSEKTWFNDQSKLSFLHAFKKLKETTEPTAHNKGGDNVPTN